MGNPDVEAPLAITQSVDANKGSDIAVGREQLHGSLPPHESYEGGHRFDPLAEWSVAEERRVVRKTDLRLLTWLCVMVREKSNLNISLESTQKANIAYQFFGLQLDRGNLSNTLADNLLTDLKLSTDDYNNVSVRLIICFKQG